MLDLEEFLRLLPHLEPADLMAISAAYEQADATVREAARAAASSVAKQGHLNDDLSRLQGSIIQWAGSDISQTFAFKFTAIRSDPVLGDLRVQAMPPLLDAATALLLKDALPEAAREALLEPLGAAVG